MTVPYPRGKVTDFGDLIHVEQWLVKGRRRFRITWHVGAPVDTTEADRVITGPATPSTGRADATMDLLADKQAPLGIEWTDEIGNPTDIPVDAVMTYTVDDPSLINLTDNGDGTATAAAVGALGTATVHVEATANGEGFTGDLAINVVAGLAERINIVAGEAVEVTPDDV